MATDPPAVYTVREIADLLRIGRNQAYAMVREGTLASFRSGTTIRVPRAAVEQLLEGTTTPESE
ncbi:MAG: helix-turn-helix domain-containing protein [Candidatus Dormibacteraeota bacterium]|jgi:excisionase family DNA binding protein|nr:helix-turn-helix domain-containing protein [Candidatus Dormibacteraeota bacterium]